MTTKNYIKGQRDVAARPRSKRLRELGISTTIVTGGGTGSSEPSADYATEANHARYSDLATQARNLTPDSTDWDTIDAKDSATLAAAIADAATKYLSKLDDDTAQGLITFLRGLRVGNGTYGIDASGDANLLSLILQSLTGESYTGPDLIGDKGFRLWQDEDGYGHLDIDYLTARMKAYFAELEIRKVTFTQGDLFFSKAGSKIVRVVPVDINGEILTPTQGTLHLFSANGLFFSANGGWYALPTTDEYTDGELLAQIYAYRCYEMSDDGTTSTVNLWEVGDMARCQTFNIEEGVYTGVQNRYYSRLVIAKGKGEMPDVNDGLQYNYVDLYVGNSSMVNRNVVAHLYTDYTKEHEISKANSGYVENGTHYFAGCDPSVPTGFMQNDLPQVGDDIAQVGSQTYTDRQNLIQLALNDGGAIKIYSGVNTYDLASFEKVRIGPKGVVVDAAYFRLRSGSGEGEEEGIPVWRGAWSPAASYARMDYVQHNGSQWIWAEDTIAQGIWCEPGDHGGWQLYVSKGDDGEAPKTAEVVLDSSSVSVVAQGDGTITMNEIADLPTLMYVTWGGERVPTANMSEIIVGGYRIKGTGQEQIARGIYPDSRNYSINQDSVTLAWLLADNRIQSKLVFSATFTHDDVEETIQTYIPVIKTKEGGNGIDVSLYPATLIFEENGVSDNTHTYVSSQLTAEIRVLDGATEITPQTISYTVSPVNALNVSYGSGTLVVDIISSEVKTAVITISVTYNGATYVRYLNVYVNRMGTWALDVMGDVVTSIAERNIVWVDDQGNTHTLPSLTEIYQDATQVAVTSNKVTFRTVDGQTFMEMNKEDGKAVVSGDYFKIKNLTAHNMNITGQSVFRGFLMREKYTIQAEDFVQDALTNWHLQRPLNEYGSWVEFAADTAYPVTNYELELPHFPRTNSDTHIVIGDEVISVGAITPAIWERYCAYVMQFVGAKMLIENHNAALTLDLFTLFQHYGDTSQSQRSFAIRETLDTLTSLECKCTYINNAYYTGIAVYWEMSTGGIPDNTPIPI